MAGAAPPAGALRASLTRVADRLTTPFSYLAVLGGLQALLMWQLRSRYGIWLAVLTSLTVVVLLVLLATVRGQAVIKLAGACVLAGLSTFVPTILAIVYRTQVGLTTEHDGLLQVESAVDRLLRGLPIYGVDWSNTPIARVAWDPPGGNPALHHLAYYPLTVLVGVPARLLSGALGKPFDYRLVLLGFALIGLLAIVTLPLDFERRFLLVCAIFVSPLITLYLWTGRNDIEFLAAVLVTVAFLLRGRLLIAAATLGIGVALKPFAWMAVPFFLLLLYRRWRQSGKARELWMSSLALAAVPLATILPFLVHDPGALWTDLVLYASGGIPDAYPIGGYGFAELLFQGGLIPRRSDGFPFGMFQLAAVLPVLWVGGRALLQRPTIGRWMAGYVVLLLGFTFFARFFNDNYVGIVITLALCIRPLGAARLDRPALECSGRLAA